MSCLDMSCLALSCFAIPCLFLALSSMPFVTLPCLVFYAKVMTMRSSDSDDLSDSGSDGGDAVAGRKRRHALRGNYSKRSVATPKKQRTRKSSFAEHVLSTTGLRIEGCGQLNGRLGFKCTCGYITMNMLGRWKQHAKTCRGKNNVVVGSEKEAMQVQTPLMLVLNAAAEMERKSQVDTYVTTYWIYKHKMAFTTGPKIHEVITLPPFLIYFILLMFFLLLCSYCNIFTARTRKQLKNWCCHGLPSRGMA